MNNPLTHREDREDAAGFLDVIRGKRNKEGLFQRLVVSHRNDYSGRSTIEPDASLGPDEIAIPATLREVSFIGREMEVFATSDAGEGLKSLARPDPAIITMPEGSRLTFIANRGELSFFDDSETGARLT